MTTSHYSLSDFDDFLASQKPRMQRDYDRCINKDLSKQLSEQLLLRNIRLVMKQVLSESQEKLKQLAPSTSATAVLAVFSGCSDELLSYALQKHRTSCALSNFPAEHHPSQEYIAQTLSAVESDWQTFELEVRQMFS